MTIAIMATGRVHREPTSNEKGASVMLIATGSDNRAQRVLIESTGDATRLAIRSLDVGEIVTVSGEASFSTVSTVRVKARRIESLRGMEATSSAAQPVAQSNG